MPVLESEKRKLQLKADTDRRDQLIEALRETDWVEAFLEDSHYKKFCVIVRNTRDAVAKDREGVIAQLSAPLSPAVRSHGANHKVAMSRFTTLQGAGKSMTIWSVNWFVLRSCFVHRRSFLSVMLQRVSRRSAWRRNFTRRSGSPD